MTDNTFSFTIKGTLNIYIFSAIKPLVFKLTVNLLMTQPLGTIYDIHEFNGHGLLAFDIIHNNL